MKRLSQILAAFLLWPLTACDEPTDGNEVTVMVVENANVRDAPTIKSSSILESLQAGTRLSGKWVGDVRNSDDRWFEFERNGSKGYIWSGNLEKILSRSDKADILEGVDQEWLRRADMITDCSEISFLESWSLRNQSSEISVGLDRAAEEAQVLSGRLRLVGIETAKISGLSEEQYTSYLKERGPQFMQYAENPEKFFEDSDIFEMEMGKCNKLINSNNRINDIMNSIMQRPVREFLG